MDLHIINGTIVNADRSFESEILCREGKITRIGKDLESDHSMVRTLDASGCLIFPGGIDPHVHMHLKTKSGYSADDFYSGSVAALHGGTTTFVDFVTPEKNQSLADATALRIQEAENCLCDHSFHVSPVEWRACMPNEISNMVSKTRLKTFKVYMAYKDTIGLKDEDILLVMKAVAKAGGMVLLHCEAGDEIEQNRNRLIAEDKTAPLYHPVSRQGKMEADAVKRAIALATEAECSVYIVHVSTKESLEHIKNAQSKGLKVFTETCPQYLLLDDTKYEGTFEDVCRFVMSPPLRKKEDQEALWEALRSGIIQTIGTDHCPFTLEQKRLGVHDFTQIPNGAGGIEHRLALMYTCGVLTGKISLNQFVALTATNAAKIMGFYPRKGVIAEGSDADLIVWNAKKKSLISAKNHHSTGDQSIYEGFNTTGSPQIVIKAGEVVVQNSILTPKTGRFLETNPL
jgi:dihydropyrimidinase